jgi:hypothetical protein
MRGISTVLALVVWIPALAACGSSGSSSTTQASRAAGAAIKGPVKIYRVKLSGAAERTGGAAAGTGEAVIAFHGASVVCWRFAHLHGFTGATSARIYRGSAHKDGRAVASLSTGPRLHHEGCRHAHRAAISAIERRPQDYYVSIHSAQHPTGAVRAQLQ